MSEFFTGEWSRMIEGSVRNFMTTSVVRTFDSKNRRRTGGGRILNSKKIS